MTRHGTTLPVRLALAGLLLAPAAVASDTLPAVTPWLAPPVPVVDLADLEEAETLVTAFHDLSPLRQLSRRHQASLHVLPRQLRWDSEEHGMEVDDLVQNLLYEFVTPDVFEYEGRAMDLMEDGRLMVRAPEAVHGRVNRLLEGLAAAAGRHATLALDVYALGAGRALPAELDAAGLAALVEQGALQPVHRRRDQVRVGDTGQFENIQLQTVVTRWDAEVAQQAGMVYPEPGEIALGLHYMVRVEDVPGEAGQRLRFGVVLRRLLELREREVSGLSRIVSNDAAHSFNSNLVVQAPRVGFARLVGSRVLDAGEGVVAVARHVGDDLDLDWVVHLRLVEVDPAPAPLDFGDIALAWVDTSAIAWPSLQLPRPSAAGLAGEDDGRLVGLEEAEGESVPFPAEHTVDWMHLLYELEEPTWFYDEWDRDPSETLMAQEPEWAVLVAPPARMEQRLAAVASLAPAHRNLQLDLSVMETSGPRGATREVCRASVALEGGSQGGALLGAWHSLLREVEVEIAQGSVVTLPEVRSYGEGLDVRATATPAGKVRLDIAAVDLTVEDFHRSMFVVERPRVQMTQLVRHLPVDGQRYAVAELSGQLETGGSQRTLWARLSAVD